MTDQHRAAWFREHARFERCGLADRASIWQSWLQWCERNAVEPSSKSKLWAWLFNIGLERWGSHFKGMKL